ncbi:MAG: hypothetical protein NXH88_17440, partial [Hyphomonas sp.]|nr:hypothetical protein [Hyphomonas sp.]
ESAEKPENRINQTSEQPKLASYDESTRRFAIIPEPSRQNYPVVAGVHLQGGERMVLADVERG